MEKKSSSVSETQVTESGQSTKTSMRTKIGTALNKLTQLFSDGLRVIQTISKDDTLPLWFKVAVPLTVSLGLVGVIGLFVWSIV